MKKLMCVMILLAFAGSTFIMTGCGGGGGGIGGILTAAFVIAIVASSGGTTAVFAANQKPSYPTELRANVSVGTNNVYLRVIPMKDNGQDETSDKHIEVKVETADISSGEIRRNISVTDLGHKQYRVEVFIKKTDNTEVPLLKGVQYFETKAATENFIIDHTVTAKALTYAEWLKTNSLPYADFIYNASTLSNTNFVPLANDVQTQFAAAENANITGLAVPTVTGKAALVASSVKREVSSDHQIFLTTDPQTNQYGPPESDRIGLSFFGIAAGTTTNFRLGNYYHFYSAISRVAATTPSETKIIAYAGNIALSEANTIPAVDSAAWATNSAAAKNNQAIVAGDVFYFRVQVANSQWQYGAIKVNSITPMQQNLNNAILDFDIKFNREAGKTNITVVE